MLSRRLSWEEWMKHRNSIFALMCLVLPIAAAVAEAESAPQAIDRTSRSGQGESIVWAFHVEKDENRNQVHYGVRVDSRTCQPVSEQPIILEWRMFEKSCGTIESLNKLELEAYGVRQPTVQSASSSGGASSFGGALHFQINGAPETDLTLYVYEQDGECRADVTVSAGDGHERLALDRIEVGVGFLWHIDHVSIHGRPTSAAPENDDAVCFSLKGEEQCEQFQVDDLGECAGHDQTFPLARAAQL